MAGQMGKSGGGSATEGERKDYSLIKHLEIISFFFKFFYIISYCEKF